jgi:hypothetical protein
MESEMTVFDPDQLARLRELGLGINKSVQMLLSTIERQDSEIASLTARAESAEARLTVAESDLALPFVLRIQDEEWLARLAGNHAQSVIDATGGQPVTIGHGPWMEENYDDVLNNLGIEPQTFDQYAKDFEIFVVGRNAVDIDSLAAVLEGRMWEGLPVRLYSQELWLLYLMTGIDPLSVDVESVRRNFGPHHPVLAAFDNEVWRWPDWSYEESVDEDIEDAISSYTGFPGLENGPSPLHSFGYRVGKSTDEADRRAVLQRFFRCRSLEPYFDSKYHDENYRNAWGGPSTRARLDRMMSHIGWLIAFQGSDSRKRIAKNNWRQDLRWIRTTLR